MPRSVRARIETRSARLRLSARKDPYWRQLELGLSIGYYRAASVWWGRVRTDGRYTIASITTADDHADADGERVLDWKQAQAAVRAWAEKQTGSGPLSVADVVRTYLEDLRARKGDRAAKGAAERLDKHLLPVLGDRRVVDLTAADLLTWRNSLVPANGADEERVRRARDTANRLLGITKAALNHAFRAGQIADDRAWRRIGAFRNVGMARKVILDPLQLQRLTDACEPGFGELVVAGAQTGCRLGELVDAKVRDLDLDAGTLRVAGKTGEREIHLAPATALLLRRAASGKRPDDHLLTPVGRSHWSRGLHVRRFAAAVARAGLDPATCFYSLRHSFISHALKQLVPVQAIADHCGTSPGMIAAHYAKFIVADRRRYAELAAPELRLDSSGADVIPLRETAR
jgi:integrase